MAKPLLRVIHGGRRNIYDALLLEEAVMRADSGNWSVPSRQHWQHRNIFVSLCRLVLFDGEATPQIVMGISAKPNQVINIAKCRR